MPDVRVWPKIRTPPLPFEGGSGVFGGNAIMSQILDIQKPTQRPYR